MPIQSQFSLSLELTRLIPLSLQAAGKTYDAAMKLARDLRSSGSDIVVEEDIAELFSRSRISDSMASSFRTTMSIPDPPGQVAYGIALFKGPGPTVTRALTEPAYFSTVVQCSFLVSIHEKSSLATCLARYFENVVEHAPPNFNSKGLPSAQSIHGTLQAIEDQTERFDWTKQLRGVSALMGLQENNTFETMPPYIVHGLIAMLPITQYFPEDRSIIITTQTGACGIVVWAHIILGLSVTVRLHERGQVNVFNFPQNRSGLEQVLVDVGFDSFEQALNQDRERPQCIILLSTSTKEELFRLNIDLEVDVIDASVKGPTKALASNLLENVVPALGGRERVLEEMRYVSCGFALCMARSLCIDSVVAQRESHAKKDTKLETDTTPRSLQYLVDRKCILDAARLLFDVHDYELPLRQVQSYETFYAKRNIHKIGDPPSCIRSILTEWESIDMGGRQSPTPNWYWLAIRDTALNIAILVLAISHVADLVSCAELPVCSAKSVESLLARSALSKKVSTWDGQCSLHVKQDVWLEIIALMMVGRKEATIELHNVCLLSDKGWSVYVNTFGDADPFYIEPGYIAISRGVPWRNGVSKHKILDGPLRLGCSPLAGEIRGKSGESASLECYIPCALGNPMIGEREDSFIVSLPLRAADDSGKAEGIRRTGFNQLWTARFMTYRTQACRHPSQLGESLMLEPGWIAVTSIDNRYQPSIEPLCYLRICLTADDKAARWRALIENIDRGRSHGVQNVLIRGPDCCFRCAVTQASSREGIWYLIL